MTAAARRRARTAWGTWAGVLAGGALLLCAPSAAVAAKTCGEPTGSSWQRATAAEAGMDAKKLQAAVDNAMQDSAIAFRVYRHGCLVAESRSAPEGTKLQTQSWSMAKGVSSVAFGRAWTLGLISPEDPLGSLMPQADEAHGKLTLRSLLSMTAGNTQALAHDFNILMRDRIQDGLTVPLIHPQGEYWNYWQTAPPLVDAAVGRAAGEDFQRFFQRELLTPLGIEPGTWNWGRDLAGNTQGFFSLFMTPDDYGRFGDLMRRGGVWRGRRLLSEQYMREAVTPTAAYGCYGWFLWLHSSAACDGRGESNLKGWDPGFFEFNGALNQLIGVFPQTDVVVVRVATIPSANSREIYRKALAAVTDQEVPLPKLGRDPKHPPFRQTAARETLEAELSGVVQPQLAPAGPARARAAIVQPGTRRADRKGRIAVGVACPPRLPSTQPSCSGTLTVSGGLARTYDVAAGRTGQLRVRLTSATLRKLRTNGRATLGVTATTAASGTTTTGRGEVVALRHRPAKSATAAPR
ncbi:hypothetical protein DSM112329_03563 [Paraconexibacter sp. AEG42_29]|uniref:Beta-lactamase-related domain-containing protein n=1 Tax=Paraconexibacter sp. AEG42_29 TaxID=2997339 RepID=A0AAU7AY96_9ACTN